TLSAQEQRDALDLTTERLGAIEDELQALEQQAKAQAEREARLRHAEAHLRSWADRIKDVTDERIKRHIVHLFVDHIEVVPVDFEVYY
ncbi:hypothetical protein NA604_22800, partial [Salmonella sp. NW379]|uniref:hypothetical protein n=1 Tax=Salmonella sp. NW379 TaxID=2947939 RepID=UPI003F42C9EA